jgi:hypothetical protein
MGAQNTTTIDFGAYPGAEEASVTITGQASILSGSLVEAWIMPTATADHSADEHRLDPPRVIAGNVVAATGFTIYGHAETSAQPDLDGVSGLGKGVLIQNSGNANNARVYGTWTVAWVWN